MDEKLQQMLKYLRLAGLLANWDRYLSIAQKGNYSHAHLLEYIVEQESIKSKKKMPERCALPAPGSRKST